MKLLRSLSIVTLVASLAFAGPIPPPPSFPGGGGGPATGTVAVTLTTPHQGGGIYWLNGVGSFTGNVDSGSMDSYQFGSTLVITGPAVGGGQHTYASLPYDIQLAPGQSASWTLDTTNTASTAVSGTYKATASMGATTVPVEEAAGTLIIDTKVDESIVP